MDYKSLISDCQSRSEEFRMMHNAEGVVHEMQCANAIEDLQAKCKRLNESRERANESAHMWESRCKMLEERVEKAETIASDLCEDFGDFVTGGIHNAAPYCANKRPECVNAYGWCNGDNKVCRGFLPKAAVWKEE